MPHYKDGTEAKLGDVVKGRGYNVRHEITGVLVGLTPGTTTCNVKILTVTRSEYTKVAQVVHFKDGKAEPIENYPLEISPTLEYGQADAFEKIG